GAHVLRRDVIAGRQAGFEQEATTRRLGQRPSAQLDPYRASTVEDVDPVIRIARVDGDPLVLFVPGIDPVELEGDALCDVGDAVERRLVAPSGVLGPLLSGGDGPISGVALVGAMRGVVAPSEQFHPYGGAREVVDRRA